MSLPSVHLSISPLERQTEKPEQDGSRLVLILIAIVIVAVLLTVIALALRLIFRRRRIQLNAYAANRDPAAAAAAIANDPNSPAAAAAIAAAAAAAAANGDTPEQYLLAGMAHAPPPPAVVRMQRYVQSNGLSVNELDNVAPLVQFQPSFLRVKSGISPSSDVDNDADGNDEVKAHADTDVDAGRHLDADPQAGSTNNAIGSDLMGSNSQSGSGNVRKNGDPDPDPDDDDDDDDEDDNCKNPPEKTENPNISTSNLIMNSNNKKNIRIENKLTSNDCDDTTCAICLDEMDTNDKVRCLPCGHVFHGLCIEEWVTKVNRCPVCNMQVVSDEALQKLRLGALDGRESASSLTRLARNGGGNNTGGGSNGSVANVRGVTPRQRRRRARGENGVFELQHTASATRLSGVSTPRSLLSSARLRGVAVLGGGGGGSSGSGSGIVVRRSGQP